jgi:hypothetical protein
VGGKVPRQHDKEIAVDSLELVDYAGKSLLDLIRHLYLPFEMGDQLLASLSNVPKS